VKDTEKTPESPLMPDFRKKPKFQWVTLSICFLLAVAFWFFVSLSKVQIVNLKYPVTFTDASPEISLLLKKQEVLDLQVKANGFNMLLTYFLSPVDTLVLSLAGTGDKTYFLPNRNLKQISQVLPYNLEAVEAKPDTLFFVIQTKGRKRVPVLNRVKYEFQDSWLALGKPEIKPDSVTLLGKPEILDKIKSWPTQPLSLTKLTTGVDTWISLDTSHAIVVQPPNVRYTLKGAEYTQANKTVPIRMTNVPGKKKIRMNPNEVKLSFLVPMNRYEEINDESFSIEVDFSKIRSEQQYIIPTIKVAPDFVRDIRMKPDRIRFVITSVNK